MPCPPSGRRPGRPNLVDGERTAAVNVRLPVSQFDKACGRATRERVTLPELLRRGLARVLDDDDADR